MLIILAFQAMQGHTIKVTWQVRLNTPMWVKVCCCCFNTGADERPPPHPNQKIGGGGNDLKRVIYWNKVQLHEKIKSEV